MVESCCPAHRPRGGSAARLAGLPRPRRRRTRFHRALGLGEGQASLKPTSALVRVSWDIDCRGGGAEGFYGGTLLLVDADTGEEIYLGNVFSASGEADRFLNRGNEDRRFVPHLRASQCSRYDENGTLHGSETTAVEGESVVVPARGAGGGDSGGGGGGGGGGHGGGDPDQPLRPGGCANEIVGTAAPDVIEAGSAGDLILALGGADRVRGGDGHDCIVGSSGRDRLFGEDGHDRLTGGRGGDRLVGGKGRNAYDAGSGDDRVVAHNGRRETVRCGPGEDTARADRNDRLRGCEQVVFG